MDLHRALRLAPTMVALLLILAVAASCGDPHNQRFYRTAPPPIVTGTIIADTPTPAVTSTATP